MQFGSQRFLSITQGLYPVGSQDTEAAVSGQSATPSRERIRLVGQHVWQYSMKLPKGISIHDGGPGGDRSSYCLPSTFEDTVSKVSVEYFVQVRVKTGTFSSGYRSDISRSLSKAS